MSTRKPGFKPNSQSKKTEPKLNSNLMNYSFEEAKNRLIEILRDKSLFQGDSVLPSGRITTYNVDMKETLLGAEGSFLASLAILHNLRDEVQAIGGTYDRVYSLAACTSQLAMMRGQEINTFFVKEEEAARRRGHSKWIEGPLKPGARVCLIQDEVLSGQKIIEVIRKLQEEADSEIVQVIGILDRLDGARTRLQDYGVDYTAIVTMEDLVDSELL